MRARMLSFRFCDFDLGMDRLLGRKIGIFGVLAAAISLTAQSSFSETTECRTGPGPPAPQGKHWYYRIDRSNNRHCWYLDSVGVQVRSHRIAATSNPTEQNPVDLAKQAPSPTEPIQPAAARLASTETVSSETSPSSIEPVQTAASRLVSTERPFSGPSVAERATTTDFVGRWLDLPKSVDLNMRDFATQRNNYTDEHVADLQKEMPTWSAARAIGDGLDHASKGVAEVGFIFLAGAIGILLYGGVLKFTRFLHSSGIRRRLTSNQVPYDPVLGLREFLRYLRQADEGRHSPRSFAPLPQALTERQNGDYLGRAAGSAFRDLGRHRAMV